MEANQFINVNESHIFTFPVVDFKGQASGTKFASEALKLPGFGKWWVWGVNATRVTTGDRDEMASGVDVDLAIYDSALSQYWWSGGSAAADAVLPIQLVAGKGGKGGFFSEPKLIQGGTILTPYLRQRSGSTPAGPSQMYITLICTLADNALGTMPIVPSLGGVINERKGEHYKALVQTAFSTNNLAVGSSRQFTLPLNKQTSMVIQQLNTDLAFTDTDGFDPRVCDTNVLVNVFDTRTTWKWVSPQGCPVSLLFGPNAARPFAAPSFFYMEADQNLAIELTNNTTAAISDDINWVFDGFLNQNVIGQRLQA
jgi:hypothetical protein